MTDRHRKAKQNGRHPSLRSHAITALLSHLVAAATFAQCQYEVTKLPIVSCGFFNAGEEPTAINDSGHVVGYFNECSDDSDHAFVWTPEEGLLTLPELAGTTHSRALDINNAGDIVGYCSLPGTSLTTAVLWRDDAVIDLGIPPTGDESRALAINNRGQVVGYWGDGDGVGPGLAPFIWEDGNLSVLPIPWPSRAFDINDAGQITGDVGGAPFSGGRAFRWTDGELLELNVEPSDAVGSGGHAINARGDVAGRVVLTGLPQIERHAFFWHDGVMHDLGAFIHGDLEEDGDLPESFARDMNDVGQVVAFFESPSRGVLWQNGIRHELNDLITPADVVCVNSAKGINNQGQIVVDIIGHAAVLTPIGRPPTDLDIDCQTGYTDLIIMLASWGKCDSCPTDVTGDGVVDHNDLAMLLASWG